MGRKKFYLLPKNKYFKFDLKKFFKKYFVFAPIHIYYKKFYIILKKRKKFRTGRWFGCPGALWCHDGDADLIKNCIQKLNKCFISIFFILKIKKQRKLLILIVWFHQIPSINTKTTSPQSSNDAAHHFRI